MFETEIQEIINKLMTELDSNWDGKASIQFMRDNDSRHWKQMEWPGFYFQFMCERIFSENNFMQIPGPKYGKVEFDGFKKIPWDFKAHTINSSSGCKVPTNGYAEIVQAIEDYGFVGFIIASGVASFDINQEFKHWHDHLKGNISQYEKDRIVRGAKSRRRKAAFEVRKYEFVVITREDLEYLGKFQGGFRNADGSPRNTKVLLDLANLNCTHVIAEVGVE